MRMGEEGFGNDSMKLKRVECELGRFLLYREGKWTN